jgi:hypothetical protein
MTLELGGSCVVAGREKGGTQEREAGSTQEEAALMYRWIFVFGALGAACMWLVLSVQFQPLYAMASPGLWLVENFWPSYRGIAPSGLWVFTANLAIVAVGSLEWIVAGLAIRQIVRRFSN